MIYNKPYSKPPVRIERWQLRLIHGSGSDNPSDYISRHSAQHKADQNTIAEVYVNCVISSSVPKAMTLEEIKHHTREDQTLHTVIDLVRSGR